MKKKVSILKTMGLILSVVCMNCAGGNVSNNGLFDNNHKELKESLVGDWQEASAGKSLYEFYQDGKKIKLRVKGVDTVMEHFDSPDGLTFSFLYKNQSGMDVFVLGQFKSYQRQQLIAVEESDEAYQNKMVFNLSRGTTNVVKSKAKQVETQQKPSSRQ